MAFESVRGYVQLASGLGELTMAKAMEAAQGLLALPGADEVTRKVVQASTLAEELLDVAKSNRANLVALVQGEVETALKRADVVRVADLEAARSALAGVSRELAELKALVRTTGASAVAGASRGTLGRSGAVSTTARPASPVRGHACSGSGSGPRPPPGTHVHGQGTGHQGRPPQGCRPPRRDHVCAREEDAREEDAREEGDREEGAREDHREEGGTGEEGDREEGAPRRRRPRRRATAKKPAKSTAKKATS